jgi:serine/threonine protein kinase
MTVERWTKIQEIYQQATKLLGNERAEFIQATCSDDDALRTEVQTLLDSQVETILDSEARTVAAGDDYRFITTPRSEDITIALSSAPLFDDEMIGRQIGAYKIEREVGRGGMGAVYLASRADEHFQTRVAIKLVKRGMGSDFVIRRFLGERQILAYLNHPNIARLLDGGATEDGSPYFVMEYIEGLPITHYCDLHRLTTTERLKLFQQVCSAIQYAHQNLVVHRDIKPGNILVTVTGEVKLLDFGIAKLLAPELSPTDTTAQFGRLMTPDYASPEQVKGEPITTASDIYSLGVLLYQLLTGHRPYHIGNTSPMEMVRLICEQEPDRPSTVINRSITLATQNEQTEKTLTPEDVSKLRDSQPDKLRRQLAGDLDNIILKAMRKEPSRRYASAEQFSEDIRRHLEGRTVTARPDTLSYRTRKFIQRNKVGVAAAILLVLTLLGGIIGTTWQAFAAKRERARAEKRFGDVRKLANSFLFEFHDSIQNLAGATPARELVVKRALEYLDGLSQEAGNDFSLQRELATAYEKVGDVQGDPYSGSLGDTTSALDSYRKSLAIREKLAAANPTNPAIRRELAASYLKVGSINWLQGKLDEAVDSNQKAVKINEEQVAADPLNIDLQVDLARSYSYLGDALTEKGALEEGLANQQKSLTMRQELKAVSKDKERAKEVGSSYAKLGDVLWRSGKLAESFESYDKAIKVFEPLLATYANDDDLRSRLEATYQRLGEALRRNKEYARALEYFEKCVKIDEARVLADPTNAVARRNLMGEYVSIGMTLSETEKYPEAVKSYRKALEIASALAVADPHNQQAVSDVMKIHLNIGIAMTNAKNWAEADVNLRTAMEIAEKLVAQASGGVGDSKDALANISVTYGYMKMGTGDVEKALEIFRKALTVRESLVAEAPANVDYRFRVADLWSVFGEAYETLAKQANTPSAKLENWQEARSWYQRSLDSINKMRDENLLSKNRLAYIPDLVEVIARCDAELAKMKGN